VSSSRDRRLRALEDQLQGLLEAEKTEIPQDPVRFFREILGFQPFSYQIELAELFTKNQFLAARWNRQSGKSHIVAALLLHYALTHPGSYIGVVGPSWRQTKLVIRRVNSFLRLIPSGLFEKPQRTIVRLRNGSVIEAFPNNPETIRGPTLHVVYADEFNFTANDEDLYDAIMFTLATTAGKFVCSSTPWTTDHLFYKICTHPDYADFARSHITWKDSVEPKGPLKQEWLEKIRRQLAGDPWRWTREMEAEWAEDETVWLSQALIASCIDHDLEPYEFEDEPRGELFLGVDLGKHQDYSVVSTVAREGPLLRLVHVHRFPLKTSYGSVIGYVKTLCDRWRHVLKVFVDQSGVGDYIVEDMKAAGVPNVEGVNFTLPVKEKIATNLKQRMVDGVLKIYYIPVRKPSDVDLTAELHVERFELQKTGGIVFSHPEGTHDDVFWSIALAVAAGRAEEPPKLVGAY